jgi:Fic family protein
MSIIYHKFPPKTAELFNEELANQLAETQAAISSLNQLIILLQNPFLLMQPILAKEAEASSQLEGTQASVEDAYKIDLAEQTEEQRNDAKELRNYEQAMFIGLDMVIKHKLSNAVIKQLHARLLQGVRGKKKSPGIYRKGEVWVGAQGTSRGEARYLPPDATQIPALMDNLESFYQKRGKVNPVIVSAILHHRFEAIHPFEDGNGRTGRLIIPLYLVDQGLLKLPILYLSGYFDKDKEAYQEALSRVDRNEDWYSWIMYYLKGVELQAKQTLDVGLEIKHAFDSAKELISKERTGVGLFAVLENVFARPVVTSSIIAQELGGVKRTALRHLELLVEKGILVEADIYKKQRVFVNENLLKVLRNI